MKALRKLSAVLLAVFLAVPMFGMIASAADGRLLFTDPQTQVGENFEVELVIRSGEGDVGDAEVTMSYDTSYLEFVSGDGFTADGSGSLTFSGNADDQGRVGTASGFREIHATMQMRALQAGSTKISVEDSSASMASGDTINMEVGSSAVTISAAADGSTTAEPSQTTQTSGSVTDIVVSVNGTDYNFSEAFTSADIPSGYAETTVNFNGADHRFVANDAGIYLGYLVDAEGAGRFFLYNTDNSTFEPYVEISISGTTSIIPLNEPDQVTLPESYQEVGLTVLDQEYPAWSDPSEDRYCLIYAQNTNSGEKQLYRYDMQDGTYQSFAVAAEKDNTSESSLPGQLGAFVTGHILVVLTAAALVILILLILMIVFAVKLVHRNQELDDLYDEYDIPYDDEEEEEEEEPAPQKKEKRGFFGRRAKKEEEEENEYDEEEYEDDDYDEDDEYDEDDGYEDEEDDEDDVEDDRHGKTKNVRKSKKSSDEEDDYEIDFIDL
ncbi:hypothetical protein B5F07_00715 [Lachnoclostridium sp. An169]|uniref:cohesin domain-containing protein n=1 Tax=Lachnoclostridium sp. An169 TaxID=1965569 RepID=UPI000B3A6814|nr:cohesin domain-containing protein [Lachnoclostridium sp. An169]OUP86544.1 hypothetical protein B5F07_00715 [Lachnoclostridium sp. An169]